MCGTRSHWRAARKPKASSGASIRQSRSRRQTERLTNRRPRAESAMTPNEPPKEVPQPADPAPASPPPGVPPERPPEVNPPPDNPAQPDQPAEAPPTQPPREIPGQTAGW